MEKRESAKERILKVADELFYREGIRAVGIDRIIEESSVAKASFYRSFPTKDDLVVAYLELRFQRSLGNFDRVRREHPDSALDQLRSLMDILVDGMKRPDYRGCAHMNAVVEFPDELHPVHAKALECRNALWAEVAAMAKEAGIPDSKELADHIRMLWSGAVMVAYINKKEFRPESFSIASKMLIEDRLVR